MKKLAILGILAIAAMAMPAHAASDFVATGTILVGDLVNGTGLPNAGELVGACDPSAPTQGTDSAAVVLPAGADGLDITVTATDDADLADADVYFYDAACGYLSGLAEVGDEAGTVPDGAAFAQVDLFTGVNATYTLTVVGAVA